MEITVASIDDVLINSLDYKLKPGASYITSRRNCSFSVLEVHILAQLAFES